MGEQIVKFASSSLCRHVQLCRVQEIHVRTAKGGLHLAIHDDGLEGRE